MIKLILYSILVFFVSVLIVLGIDDNTGYVLISRSPWGVEMSLVLFILLCVALFVALHTILRLASNIYHFPGSVSQWRKLRAERQTHRALTRGLFCLAKGSWSEAEKRLLSGARLADEPTIFLLAAASAAHEQNKYNKRDTYLKRAFEHAKKNAGAVSLVQAELLLRAGQYERALATLMELNEREEKNPKVLSMLAQTLVKLSDWQKLAELVPKLEKYGLLNSEIIGAHEAAIYASYFSDKDGDTIDKAWSSLPRRVRASAPVAIAYVRRLLHCGLHEKAEQILREKLDAHWHTGLIRLYGETSSTTIDKQLGHAERWLKKYADDNMLHLTLGRLALKNQLWGKAKYYLEKSLALKPLPETYAVLATLLEREKEHNEAAKLYQKGLYAATEMEMPRIDVSVAELPPSKEAGDIGYQKQSGGE